jgi:hypothetical protein
MANQKQNFTPEMRKATGPNSPPGGSRLVRGREPTVVGQANMMSSFAHDDANVAVPLEDPVPGTSSNAPSVPPSPNTGFFDEEYKNGKRTGSPPTTERTNQSADSGKRTNQDAGLGPSLPPHPPKRTSTKVGALSTNTDPPLSEPTNRCVGLLLREGEAFTRTSFDIDLESPEECRQLSDRIYHSLMFENWKPDFKAQHIPSRQRDAIVHDTLSRLLADREKTELRLNELTTNEHPDGTRRDRDEDVVETTYQRLQTRYNNFNRAMLTIYVQFLIADLPPRTAPTDTALAVLADESSSTERSRPYSHIRDHPRPSPTVPQFAPVVLDDTTQHALLTHKMRPCMQESMPNSVWCG